MLQAKKMSLSKNGTELGGLNGAYPFGYGCIEPNTVGEEAFDRTELRRRKGFSQSSHSGDIEADGFQLFISGGGDLLEAAELFQETPATDLTDAGDLVQFGGE